MATISLILLTLLCLLLLIPASKFWRAKEEVAILEMQNAGFEDSLEAAGTTIRNQEEKIAKLNKEKIETAVASNTTGAVATSLFNERSEGAVSADPLSGVGK
jgi:hypothetical protein